VCLETSQLTAVLRVAGWCVASFHHYKAQNNIDGFAYMAFRILAWSLGLSQSPEFSYFTWSNPDV